MKTHKYFRNIFVLLLILGITSCDDLFNKDDNTPEPEILIEYETVRTLLPVMVDAIFDQLVAVNPGIRDIEDRIDHGVVVYRISYRTTYKGEPVVASGLVSAPLSDGTFPVISYQNGTNTLHENAPSVNPEYELYALLQLVASTGFVITMPDYLGFGESDEMFHPYLHTSSTVPVVLDMLKAAAELGEIREHRLNNDLYLAGYSQGGWATLQVQKEIEENPTTGFNLKASAPGGGPYDLTNIYDNILSRNTYAKPYFLAYLFNSYTNTGDITTPLEDVFKSPYDELTATLFNGTLSGNDIDARLTTTISDLFTEDFVTNRHTGTRFASVSTALAANSVEPWALSTPTRLVHSTNDELVPFETAEQTYQEFIEAGTNPETLTLVPIESYSHTGAIIPAGLVALQWFFELTED